MQGTSLLNPLRQFTRGKSIPNRAHRGLYAGKGILSGHKISKFGNKSKRKWLPNVFEKKLYSETFDTKFNVKCTAHALRCIDKAGGLDNYMLNVYEPVPGALMNKLRRKILKEIKRREWAAANPEEAAAIEAAEAKQTAIDEAAAAEAERRRYLKNFSWITIDEAKAKWKEHAEKRKWKRNW